MNDFCQCGKKIHSSRSDARRARVKQGLSDLETYRCEYDKIHLGHAPGYRNHKKFKRRRIYGKFDFRSS